MSQMAPCCRASVVVAYRTTGMVLARDQREVVPLAAVIETLLELADRVESGHPLPAPEETP